MTRAPNSAVGLGRSDLITFTIPNGQDDSAVTPLNFLRGYKQFIFKCVSAANIAAATNMKFKVSYDTSDAEVDLYKTDDPATILSIGPLPTGAVTFGFVLTHALAAQKIRPILTVVTTGSVVFTVFGLDPTVSD